MNRRNQPICKGVYLLPNLFTTASLFSGFLGIIWAVEGRFDYCALAILVSCVLDGLDGMVARLTSSSSEFGVQLDSLADLVSFGILPGLLLLKLQLSLTGTYKITVQLSEYTLSHFIIIFTPLLIPLFSALRLARFDNDPSQSDIFRGLPTPANALFIAALVWSASQGIQGMEFIHNSGVIYIVTTIMAILMISPFRFISLKFHNFKLKDNYVRYLFLFLSLGLLIIWKIPGIMFVITLYVIFKKKITNNF